MTDFAIGIPVQAQALPEFEFAAIYISANEPVAVGSTTNWEVVVELSAPGTDEVSFRLYTPDATTTDGEDYTGFGTTIVLPPGTTTSSTVAVIHGDDIAEASERFSVT